jgi:putative endonuclease
MRGFIILCILFIFYIQILGTDIYIGFTGDEIQERLRKHNSNHQGFTGKVADWKIFYTESFPQKMEL